MNVTLRTLLKLQLGLTVFCFVAVAALLPGCSQKQPQMADEASPAPDAIETQIVEEHWPNGQLRLRKHVLTNEDGTTVDHGLYERWHDNGQKEYEVAYDHGKKEGTETRYHKNGAKWTQREFRDGKRNGPSTTWDESGEKVKEENWADGKPHGVWTVWKHGEIEWRHTFDHGVPAP